MSPCRLLWVPVLAGALIPGVALGGQWTLRGGEAPNQARHPVYVSPGYNPMSPVHPGTVGLRHLEQPAEPRGTAGALPPGLGHLHLFPVPPVITSW